MNFRRAFAVASFDFVVFRRNRAAVLNFLGTAACLAFLCWMGTPPVRPSPGVELTRSRQVAVVGDEAALDLKPLLEANGIDVSPESDVVVTVGRTGEDTRSVTVSGLAPGDPRTHGVTEALGMAEASVRRRLLDRAGLIEAYDEALLVVGLPDRPRPAPPQGYEFTLIEAFDRLTLPDVSAPLALMVALSAMIHALVDGYLVLRYSGRLEFLYGTEVTPAEYVASRFVVALVASATLSALGVVSLQAILVLDGEPVDHRAWGLLVAGPLAASVLLPMGLIGATMFRRLEAARLGMYVAMSPILAVTGIVGLAGAFGFDPAWQAYWPVQGVARWLQGREVDTSALLISTVASGVLLTVAATVAVRLTRATCFAHADL